MTETPATTPGRAPRTIPLGSLEEAQDVLTAATRADGLPPLSDGLLEAAAAGTAVVLGVLADDATSTVSDTSGADAGEVSTTSGAGAGEVSATSGAGTTAAGRIVGVGVAALQGERWAAEAAVDPAHRGRGLGRVLVTDLDRAARDAGGSPWFWSHGDHPAAAHMAAAAGRVRARELLQLTTDGVPELPAVDVPDGIVLRDVRPEDADAWAAVNNAAFSWHPEQGGQDPEDYRRRIREPGFDAGTVIIAERTEDGHVLGFHETKMHAQHPSGLTMGEVHVIGVDPQVHARGLGRALLVEGMARMLDAGAEAIELYVESDNEKALPLYRRVGFSRTVVHVSYKPSEVPHEV